MELWHWDKSTRIDYAVATMWYAPSQVELPGYPDEDRFVEEVRSPVSYVSPPYLPEIKGFTFHRMPRCRVFLQNLEPPGKGRWEDGDQLCVMDAKRGDRIDLIVSTEKSGPQKLVCSMTKARNYGIVQFYFDGKKTGDPIDLYAQKTVPTGKMTIGDVVVDAGEHVMTVEIVDKNIQSTGLLFGLDTVAIE